MNADKLNTLKLWDHGQSIWLDDISKCLIDSGSLEEMVYQQGIRGVTTNPSIFEKAISSGDCGYPEEIRKLLAEGKDAVQVYETLSCADVGGAADIMRKLYDESSGLDGFVSWEVAPQWADDEEKTISEAHRLAKMVDRPNVFIKVPSTPAGIRALRTLIRQGISVNMTLIFSREQYRQVAESYLTGLEDRLADGQPLYNVSSVASVFISRVDSIVDVALAIHDDKEAASSLQGTIGVANTKMVYQDFLSLFKGERFDKLALEGARVQRPLWASTGTKNPAYSDTLYVDQLVASETVNTVPTKTIEAFKDHGEVVADAILQGVEQAEGQLQRLEEFGVSLEQITTGLLSAGLKAFADSYDQLIDTIRQSLEVAHES